MTDLVAFLRERLVEDEYIAWRARPDYFQLDTIGMFSAFGDARHVLRHNPPRVLAEVASKRSILGEHLIGNDRCDEYATSILDAPCPTILALAQPYADHPDFDPAWRTP